MQKTTPLAICDLRTPLAICQKSRKPSVWEVIAFLLVQTGLAAPRTLLQRLVACLKLTLDEKWLQTKEVISMSYGNSTSSWKPWRWMRFHLIFTMRDIYINFKLNPFKKLSSSTRSTEKNTLADGLTRRISSNVRWNSIKNRARIQKVWLIEETLGKGGWRYWIE